MQSLQQEHPGLQQEPAPHHSQPTPFPALFALPQSQSHPNNLRPPQALLPPPSLTPTPRPRLKRDRNNAGLGLGIGSSRIGPSGGLQQIDEMPLSEDEGWTSPNSRRVHHIRGESNGDGGGDSPDDGSDYGGEYFAGSSGGGPGSGSSTRGGAAPRRKRLRPNLESMEPAFASLSLAPAPAPSLIVAPIENAWQEQQQRYAPQLVPLSSLPQPPPPSTLPTTVSTTSSSQLPVTPPMQQTPAFLSPPGNGISLSPTPSPQPPSAHHHLPPGPSTPTPTIQTERPTPTSTPEIIYEAKMPSISFNNDGDYDDMDMTSSDPSTITSTSMDLSAAFDSASSSASSTNRHRRSPSSYEISKDRIVVLTLDDSDDESASPSRPPTTPEPTLPSASSSHSEVADPNSMEVQRALGLSEDPNDAIQSAILKSALGGTSGDLVLYRPLKFGPTFGQREEKDNGDDDVVGENERVVRRRKEDFMDYQRKVLEEARKTDLGSSDDDDWKEIHVGGSTEQESVGNGVEEDVEMDLDG